MSLVAITVEPINETQTHPSAQASTFGLFSALKGFFLHSSRKSTNLDALVSREVMVVMRVEIAVMVAL